MTESDPIRNPIRDPARLAALKATGLLDSPREASFDRLTRMASKLLKAPVALVSLVDSDRQFFKSSHGLADPWAKARQTPLSHSFCKHIVMTGEPLIVEDAQDLPILRDHGAVCDLGVVAYLGIPLMTEDGLILGSFCIIDGVPRKWTEDEMSLLSDLADSVTAEITLRVEKAELQRAESRLSIQHGAALILAEADSLDTAIGPILRLVGEGLNYEVGEFWKLDLADGRLRKDAAEWSSGPSFASFEAASRHYSFAKGEGLPGRVWASGNPAWIENLTLDDDFVRRELAASVGLRCGFGLPIVGDQGLVGVVTFFYREAIAADDLLLQALSTLGHQLGQFASRRAAEARVIRLNDQLCAVQDAAMHVSIIATDEQGLIFSFNTGAERMLGHRREDVLNRMTFRDILLESEVVELLDSPTPKTDTFDAFWQQTREKARDDPDWHIEREMTFVRKDGIRLNVLVVLRAIRDPGGEVVGLLGIAADMTSRLFAEREFRKFAALVEHSGDFIAMVDEWGKFTYVNPSGRELVGLGEDSASLGDLVDDPTLALDSTRIREAILESGHWVGERTLKHLGGGPPIAADVNLFAVNDPENSRLLCLAAIIRDARPRKRAEELLIRGEARLRAILESSLDCLITINHEGKIVEFNPAAERTFGLIRDQVIGVSFVDQVIPPEFQEVSEKGIRRFLETGERGGLGRRIEIEAVRAGGAKFPAELAISVVETGGISLFSATLRDISERRQAEHRLRESEIRFRQSFENAPIGMALVAPDGRWLRVNRALCQILGYSELQLLGMDFQGITHPEDLENDLDHVRRVLDGSLSSYQIEKRYLHGEGRVVWTQLGVSLVRDSAGEPLHFISQIQDITDRKEFEEALHRARDSAMEAARAKSDFLANMSHEVRTPMAAVLGYSDMLLNPRLLQAERDHALQAIRRNGSHLLQIINDILDLSKIEAGRMELDLISYSPWQVALEVASSLRIRADERGVSLETLALGPLPDPAIMDPTRVRQILVNLVSNAIKFSEPGGTVALKMEATPTGQSMDVSLTMEVEDHGIGMSPSQVEQLFIPFQQADSSTTRKFGGTGLGLSISRRLAESMGGVVSVRSEIGQGSSFKVSIPLTVKENRPWLTPGQLAIKTVPDEVHDENLGQVMLGRILLAEDNPDNQKVLLYHLCRMGLEVVIVDNGRLAVEKALRGNYDLVLMDMQMPELDGYGATSSLRRSGFSAPIIALTAHAMAEDREKCLRVGCTDFLTKPVEAKLLASTIARYLGPGQAGFAIPDDAVRSDYRHDPDLSALLRSFGEGLSAQVETLRALMAAGDLPGVSSIAHQLRGVGGMYGYPMLTENAGLLEDSIREGCDGELVRELVEELIELAYQIGRGLEDLPEQA